MNGSLPGIPSGVPEGAGEIRFRQNAGRQKGDREKRHCIGKAETVADGGKRRRAKEMRRRESAAKGKEKRSRKTFTLSAIVSFFPHPFPKKNLKKKGSKGKKKAVKAGRNFTEGEQEWKRRIYI